MADMSFDELLIFFLTEVSLLHVPPLCNGLEMLSFKAKLSAATQVFLYLFFLPELI